MTSPRSGFRRAAATSWALAGIGMAGVAGASALAYADTVKAPPAEAPTDVVEQAPAVVSPTSVPDDPPAPPLTTADAPPPPSPATAAPPETIVDQAPTRTYPPKQTYVPEQTVEQAPATHQAPTTPRSTSTRRALTPTTVRAPNFSPQISRSRGS